jgi:hypothetical protein
METERGKQIGAAIRAVLEMQSDCIRLFRDLDKHLSDLQPLAGMDNIVTTNLGASINAKQLFLAEYFFRLYSPTNASHRILGVNVCFHDHPKRHFSEPLFVVANSRYMDTKPDRAEELWRSWDPWAAWLDWTTDKEFGKALEVTHRRPTLEKIVVAAVPLFSITSLDDAVRIINLVGHP